MREQAPGRTPPAFHVHGAAEHDRVVPAGDVCVLRAHAVHVVSPAAELIGDRIGDLAGGAVLARDGDEDAAHGRTSGGCEVIGPR